MIIFNTKEQFMSDLIVRLRRAHWNYSSCGLVLVSAKYLAQSYVKRAAAILAKPAELKFPFDVDAYLSGLEDSEKRDLEDMVDQLICADFQ